MQFYCKLIGKNMINTMQWEFSKKIVFLILHS